MTARQEQLYRILAGPVVPAISSVSPIPTDWIAITGAPGAGKSTVCDELAKAGHRVIPEASRAAINEAVQQSFPVQEIFSEAQVLSEAILVRKLAIAASLPPTEPYIWDTGLVDALVFCRSANVDASKYLSALLAFRFRNVILLEPLASALISGDPVRPQGEGLRASLHAGLVSEYEGAGYRPARIPFSPLPERMRTILPLVGNLS